MHYEYKTRNTCSTKIAFDMDENHVVSHLQFTGGCNGNLKAIASLVDGLTAEQIIAKCQGITCGFRDTSCSDQLSQAVAEAVQKL